MRLLLPTLAIVLALPTIDFAAPAPRATEVSVVWVVDGDTIHVQLDSRVEKVRYIGINAPEIPHPHSRGAGSPGEEHRRLKFFPHTAAAGEAAKRINLELVSGKRVRLEFDRQRRDHYKRLLAYVWVGDTMANAEMVKRGYAEVMSVPPDFRHRALLTRLQDEARQAGRGLWREARAASVPSPRKHAPASRPGSR